MTPEIEGMFRELVERLMALSPHERKVILAILKQLVPELPTPPLSGAALVALVLILALPLQLLNDAEEETEWSWPHQTLLVNSPRRA